MKQEISTEDWWNSLYQEDKAYVFSKPMSPCRPSDMDCMNLQFQYLPTHIQEYIISFHRGDFS